jgi:ATP-dependent Clp protease protease subunit
MTFNRPELLESRRSNEGNLLKVFAMARPPAIEEVAHSADWQFETRALAADFVKFEVTALASSNPTISIFDYIGDDGMGGGVPLAKVAGALRSIGDKPVTVEINSPGGNYFEGVAIYNLLRRHTQAVNVQVLGIAASAASIVAMAGDHIAIAHNAEIMIHQARGLFMGTAEEMADAMATLQKLDGAMADTYAARTGLEREQLLVMMKAETFIGGQEAVDQGFADEVMQREAQAPVYAAADDFPTDQVSLDKFLAKKANMPRAERRELFRALKGGATSSTEPEALRAEGEPEETDLAPLFKAMSLN